MSLLSLLIFGVGYILYTVHTTCARVVNGLIGNPDFQIIQPDQTEYYDNSVGDGCAVADAAHPLLIADNRTISVALEGTPLLSVVYMLLLSVIGLTSNTVSRPLLP